MLPPFFAAGRRRPTALVRDDAGSEIAGAAAPFLAVTADLTGEPPATLSLTSGDTTLAGRYDGAFGLEIITGGHLERFRSRRSAGPAQPPTAMALTLTGAHVGVWSREGTWVLRGRVDITRDLPTPLDPVDPRDEDWLAGLRSSAEGHLDGVRGGAFGQLGLRDLRLVTRADGTTYFPGSDGTVLLTATSAGPGFFDTAHTSVWSLDPSTLDLTHRSDLFFRRPDRPGVFGDHATHLVRDEYRWLVATSTWGDFDQRRKDAGVRVTLAASTADLTSGTHVLDTREFPLPTDGLTSVGVWDPHLVRAEDRWLVAYVSASKFFRFHPVLATGPTIDDLTLRGAASDRLSTEGSTLVRLDGVWRVLASDGRDNRRGQRERYPVFDLDLREIGTLAAPYPTNIPWPTLVPTPDGGQLLIGFDGTSYGGRLVGYGSHGDVVFARTAARI